MYSVTVPQRGGGIKSFSWDGNMLDDLEASFSSERLGTHLKAAGGDRAKALHLYTWNTAISAAFYGPLQGLEVVLRNAMHRRLTESYGAAWYDNLTTGLDSVCLDRLAAAKTEAARTGQAPGPPQIVAALSFGFWISLLGPEAASVRPVARRTMR